jgi:hypothetical protein
LEVSGSIRNVEWLHLNIGKNYLWTPHPLEL